MANKKDTLSSIYSVLQGKFPSLNNELLSYIFSLLSLNQKYKSLSYKNFINAEKPLDLFKIILKGFIIGFNKKRHCYINKIDLDDVCFDK